MSNETLNDLVQQSYAGPNLLHRQSYQAAKASFQSALMLVQNTFTFDSNESYDVTSLSNMTRSILNVREVVNQGLGHLDGTDIPDSKQCPFYSHVIDDDHDPFGLDEIFQQATNESIYVLRMSSIHRADASDSIGSTELFIAIILQNLASTYFFLSFMEEPEDDEKADFLLKCSYKLFQSSEHLLLTFLGSNFQTLPSILPQILTAVLVVTRNLQKVTFHLGINDEAQSTRGNLQIINQWISKLQELHLIGSGQHDTAPAA